MIVDDPLVFEHAVLWKYLRYHHAAKLLWDGAQEGYAVRVFGRHCGHPSRNLSSRYSSRSSSRWHTAGGRGGKKRGDLRRDPGGRDCRQSSEQVLRSHVPGEAAAAAPLPARSFVPWSSTRSIGPRISSSSRAISDQPDPRNVDRAFVADCLRRLREQGVRGTRCPGTMIRHGTAASRADTPPRRRTTCWAAILFDSTTEILTDVVEIRGMRVAIGGLGPDPAAPPGTDPLSDIRWPIPPGDVDVRVLSLHGPIEGHAPDFGGALIRLETLGAWRVRMSSSRASASGRLAPDRGGTLIIRLPPSG